MGTRLQSPASHDSVLFHVHLVVQMKEGLQMCLVLINTWSSNEVIQLVINGGTYRSLNHRQHTESHVSIEYLDPLFRYPPLFKQVLSLTHSRSRELVTDFDSKASA